ncbi:hypothetical protein KFK14_12945 [Sphingobium phenoxybenzoativorans]|uniref:Uncharacterized protein n=1 Tax=Sphingobium phenoxybenzoativorans TaxID=1592790 RepID=A0A975K457_9SPHN|nr:hypothetical protein [Sphingobium phenoxybenzoativorans]QUT04054.1 hypothetical protein KFK14_12945 [Sphingobium phenoxybenzoativorans]
MSTFIELVNDLERESGTIYQNARLTSVLDAPGRQEKMVEWIIEAWRLIQTSRSDWPWMRAEFTSALIPGQSRYAAADFDIEDFGGWAKHTRSFSPFTLYEYALGQGDERELYPSFYHGWKARWDRGVHEANRPCDYAIDQDKKLCLGPKPDKDYVIRGAYRRAAQILAADTDVPICPVDHHMTIVWRAAMLMGQHDEAIPVVAAAQSLYAQGLRNMLDDMDEQVEA